MCPQLLTCLCPRPQVTLALQNVSSLVKAANNGKTKWVVQYTMKEGDQPDGIITFRIESGGDR